MGRPALDGCGSARPKRLDEPVKRAEQAAGPPRTDLLGPDTLGRTTSLLLSFRSGSVTSLGVLDEGVCRVPTGRVKWFDAEKGFGFLADDAGGDVFLHANALPEGQTTIKPGARVEFGIVQGRRGAQALQVKVLEPAHSVEVSQRNAHRKPTEDMVVIVEDVIKLLDNVSETLRRGKYPDKNAAAKVSQVLKAVASDLEA